MARQPATVKVARWSAVRPWRAIGAWIVFVAVCVGVSGVVGTRMVTPVEAAVGEWGRAEQIVAEGNFKDPAQENVLLTSRSGGSIDKAEGTRAAQDVLQRLRALPEVESAEGPVPSPDSSAMLVQVAMTGDKLTASERVEPLLGVVEAVQGAYPGLRVEMAGDASTNKAVSDTQIKDFQRAEIFSIPLTLIILVFVFGALIAASIPLVLSLTAVAAAIALSAVTSHVVPSTSALSSIILLIGLAVGVDYSLFYIRREREERRAGREHREAVEIAAATSGHAVVVSGLAVIVSMAALFVVGNSDFSSIATGTILVVAIAVLGSVTVLPALLSKLGKWVDRPRVPFLWRMLERRRESGRSIWATVLKPSLRFPKATLLISVLALLAMALPMTDMRLKVVQATDMPASVPIIATYQRLTAAFPSTNSEHLVAVEAPAGKSAAVNAALRQLIDRTSGDPLFAAEPISSIRTSQDGRVATVGLGVPFDPRDEQAERSLQKLRDEYLPETVGTVPGARYAVGGQVAVNHDYVDEMVKALPWVVGIVLLLTFIVLLLTFRSVVVALTAIVLNLLSAGAAFGLLTLVFQRTWAEDLLDFRSNGGIVSWLPLMLFVILFGLSMDYHVFVVSRIREAYRRGEAIRDAVRIGIVGSAGVVTSAAIIMVGVFSVFGTLTALEFKQLGVGLAVAILIDAIVIRAIVLPAAMIWLGKANWWAPRFLHRADDQQPSPQPAEVPVSAS
ncbi:MMPL family transporter [Micromonospora siamensis]|uniref:Putative drug exporter of the RND superfamily n=1 Tax=Micromonospora siamensis TaxID=299152 RepID=A0A1C5HEM0_9ACTN|nr:MMPL family transporter [Micromonospora siamensis]SCG44472.1 putative drug exporter of the RND superfamily [Micromonospora siamensis]